MVHRARRLYFSVLSALLAGAVAAQDPGTYLVTRTVALGSPERWDYLTFDAPSHRVYVAHGDEVTVVDGHDGTVLGRVKGIPGGTHGIAIVPGRARGYTVDGRAGEAISFDTQTFVVRKHIPAAADADAVVYDPASRHVFVVNGDPGTLTVIDPQKDAAVATVEVGGKLEFAVPTGDGKLFVNGAEKREVVRVDTRTNRVDARWPVAECESPHGLAMDRMTRRLFVSCVNQKLVVLNADTGAIVQTLPIGRGTDAAAFDPRRKRVFSSNGRDGTLSVIQQRGPDEYVPLAEVKTRVTARTMSLDPESGRVYLVAAELDPKAPPPQPGVRRPPPLVPGSTTLLFLNPDR
jgi:DNA-binding beta-propeller fold protein YncE